MIKIIDLYSGNDFNAPALKAQGYAGVIFKAGQGEWADVPRYKPDWWQQAKDAGLLRGWYWLVDSRYPSSGHLDEMKKWDLFSDLGELRLWLDVEKPVITMTDSDYWKTAYAGPHNVVDVAYNIRLLGYDVGTYTGPGAWNLIFGGASQVRKDYMALGDLWTAQYTTASQPQLYGSWKTWTWWQKQEGPDVNVFNGTDEEFYQKYGNNTSNDGNPPPTGEPMPYLYKVTASKDVNERNNGDDVILSSTLVGTFRATSTGYGNDVKGDPNGAYYCLHVIECDGQPVDFWVYARHNSAQQAATIEAIPQTPPPPASAPVLDFGPITATDASGNKFTVSGATVNTDGSIHITFK